MLSANRAAMEPEIHNLGNKEHTARMEDTTKNRGQAYII